MREVPGSGDPARRAQLLALIETVSDPCSVTFGRPTGLVSMGIIDRLDVGTAGDIDLWIMPTIPGCLFLGVIEERIEAALPGLSWSMKLRCHHADGLWDPSRLHSPRMSVEAA
jgi:metal-sulfur cluster biosynthetic enzyme